MGRVAVLSTGGTIASRAVPGGGSRASMSASELLERVPVPKGVRVVGRDVRRLNSFALTPEDMLDVLTEVRRTLTQPEVDGVVITHGTDAMEETAFFVDLFHGDERPVVFTGAQRPADAADPDGPSNLRDAIVVAADPQARGAGVLVVFDGSVFAARGVRKVHTLAAAAFGDPDAGAIGGLAAGRFGLFRSPIRVKPLEAAAVSAPLPRVDIAAVYPGSDATALVRSQRPAAWSSKPPVPATRPRPSRPRWAAWLPVAPRSWSVPGCRQAPSSRSTAATAAESTSSRPEQSPQVGYGRVRRECF